MRRSPRVLVVSLVLLSVPGVLRADEPVRKVASWTERDARIWAFSPDGKTLVSSGPDGFQLRETRSGKVRAGLAKGPYELEGPTFSPDGRLLFAKVVSNTLKPIRVFDLKVWEVATGREKATFPYIADGPNASTEHFALSPDGTLLAFLDNSERLPVQVESFTTNYSGQEFKSYLNMNPGLPRVKLWDIHRWQEIAVLDGGSHMVFSPDGKTLATGSQEWKVPIAKLWDTASGDFQRDLVGQAQWVKPMTFSPDGRFLAVGGSGDQTLWELASGKSWKVPVELHGSNAPLFSPDGTLLFPNGTPRDNPSHNMNQEFPCYKISTLPPRKLDLAEGQKLVQPITLKEPRLLVSLPTMRFLDIGAEDEQRLRKVIMRSLPDLKPIAEIEIRGLIQAKFSPDGQRIVLWTGLFEQATENREGRYRCELQLLDPVTGVLVTIPTPDEVWGDPRWTFSPDGQTLAVAYIPGTSATPNIGEKPRTIDIWDLAP